VFSIKSFNASHVQLRDLLSSSPNFNLSMNRYLRLMLLAGTDLLFCVPLGIWVLWVNVKVCPTLLSIFHTHF
jgi:hypothetical protein